MDERSKIYEDYIGMYFSSVSSNKKDNFLYEYCYFSGYIHNLCIRPGDYIIDTGNFRNVNDRMLQLLEEKRKKHPIIWKVIEWLIRV